MLLRKPVVADQFYKEDFAELTQQIESSFNSELGPSVLPGSRTAKQILGAIAPHASYKFSGPCQAWAYKEIAEAKLPQTYIILGPNHSFPGNDEVIIDLDQDWQTPLGKVQVNQELGKKLLDLPFVKNDKAYHENEHSIEVQLPFLQYATRDQLKDLKVLPVMINQLNLENAKAFAEKLTSITKDITIIASSDFTHYGPIYGYTPFLASKAQLKEQDTKVINSIKALDSEAVIDYIKKTKLTICGLAPIIYLIECLKILQPANSRLLIYYSSSDITKDNKNKVGYASVVFEK